MVMMQLQLFGVCAVCYVYLQMVVHTIILMLKALNATQLISF